MDKLFLEPEIEIVRVQNSDVICTSEQGGSSNPDEGCGEGQNEVSVSWW